MTEPNQRNPDLRSCPEAGRHSRARPAATRRRAAERRASPGSTPAEGDTSDNTSPTASSTSRCQPNSSSNPKLITSTSIQRQDSSGDDSNDGGNRGDPKAWFHQFNQNPSANLHSNAMDVDPPFYQNQSGGSEAGPKDPIPNELLPTRKASALALRHDRSKSSSTEDYRSVIDDLTVEIKRLKDELRRYRHAEDGALRKQRLFEIKTHGLPQWKKRELEATLRDFAAGVGGTSSTDASSSMRKRSSRHTSRVQGSSSMSKHASSSSGSHLRPVDSAYASMSTGNTSGNSLGGHSKRANSRDTEQKVEDYLKEIPEGLYPRHITMSDREKKKLVVRRLEQLFTGKATGKQRAREHEAAPLATGNDGAPAREARILPTTNPKGKTASAGASGSATQSNTNLTSQSNTDLTSWSGNKSGGNDNVSGTGSGSASGNRSAQPTTNISPSSNPSFEQRPTRPRDLDPDRMPDPSENMEYLRHLGVTPAPGSSGARRASGSPTGVAADAEGWVYLNLLCNLAQLHIFNVAPSFVRAAVAEKSAKFQLSSDGRKIRWRGGSQGTAFSSESSGQGSGEADEGDTSGEGSRKRRKTRGSGNGSGDVLLSERNTSEESFHYKPLFARGESPGEQRSHASLSSSGDSGGDSYNSGSGWEYSGSTSSRRRKRRIDGAIIYYSGAPFCTDLSGDPGCLSPTTYMISSGEQERQSSEGDGTPTSGKDTLSGLSLAYRPMSVVKLAEGAIQESSGSPMDTSGDMAMGAEENDEDEDENEALEVEFPWSDSKQEPQVHLFEPCGLGGVLPEDHFIMTVTTKRPKEDDAHAESPSPRVRPQAKAPSMVERLASKAHGASRKRLRPSTPLDIEYVSGRVKRLRPATLPPPAVFLPPFSSSDESSDWGEDESEADDEGVSSGLEALSSQRVNPHLSDKSFRVSDGASSKVEDESTGESSSSDEVRGGTPSAKAVRARRLSKGSNGGLVRRGSLAATAGGASSGYSSSKEGSG